ncbi:F0F1 ATP synthase subunit A [Schaalia sp. 19OD2882]|uniref:F0F1 ATP synthase subunit A n=1 Tax=Schaalia sp. 19OD2882 TaxID=2794089 RepID=UPI001C1F177A|nr:F0F1 ATP synthase subunit A [Schaalia sp. 19OD2882]QWW20637.1 F0F1 ATP synthase subunit A [Schaalia sp. 19OD2882]
MSALTQAEATPARTYRTPTWYWVLVAVLVAVIAVTAVPAFTQEPHQPGVADFFPSAIFGEGTVFEFNRLTLARFVMAGLLCLAMVLGVRKLSMVPGRGQQILELAADFIRGNIAVELLGDKRGRQFAPMLTMSFLSILLLNLAGVFPGIDIAATSAVAVPLVFATYTYVTFISAGIKAQGVGHFFASQLFPPGLPKAMYLLITPIEFLSTFIVRPVTLTLRLLANMIAGHLLLGMTYFGTALLLHELKVMSSLSVLTGAAMVVMTGFEIFVAVLQAYIFTILSAVYIKLSVEAH